MPDDPAPQPQPRPESAEPRVPWVVGVSGASGTPYAASVLRGLLAADLPVDLVVSRAARLTLLDETGVGWRDGAWREPLTSWLTTRADGRRRADADDLADRIGRLVTVYPPADLGARPSSGSYPTRGMIVVPASTASVAGITLGLSKDLLQRAADVTLKEGRRLVVVPREMPYTRATLRHMLDLDAAGAVVAAASPGFYAGAHDVEDLADFVAGRVLDAAGVPNALFRRWTGTLGDARGARAADAVGGPGGGRDAERDAEWEL